MRDPLFAADDEANTPLEAEERDAMIPTYITLRRELNEAEQVNIAGALRWLSSRRRKVLDEPFLRALHKQMFGQVWRWAGTYRQTARNIGVDAWRIPMDVAQAVDDACYWIEHQSFLPDEIAVRFSHKLVAIHPFPNGNGRLSRLVGDLLAEQLWQPRFTWGSVNLIDPNETRRAYVQALRAADGHDFDQLIAFARS